MLVNAPFPWFGGKSKVAKLVWSRFGDVAHYVEPFFGSGAVLLGAPADPERIITINDLDGFIANFWRAVSADPEAVVEHCDWPVNESDLHARHSYLVRHRDELAARLEGDPDYYDPQIAGWWVWGIGTWIGGEFCSGKGPWHSVDGRLVRLSQAERKKHAEDAAIGVQRRKPHIARQMGVHKKSLRLGVNRIKPHLGNKGMGIHKKSLRLSCDDAHRQNLTEWFATLQRHLRYVRVCCGDWSRICTPTVVETFGVTGVFFDPPYSSDRTPGIYAAESMTVAHDVQAWCVKNQSNPKLRIALCGHDGEHDLPGWECVAWKAGPGHARNQKATKNRAKERIWFSPHCLSEHQGSLCE